MTDLYLIGDVDGAHLVGAVGQAADLLHRRHRDTVGREAAVDEGRGGIDPALAEPLGSRGQRRRHVDVRIAVSIGGIERLDMRRLPAGEPFLRRDRRDRIGHAVIREASDQRATAAGPRGRETPGRVVRLAPGVHEQNGVETRSGGHRGDQPLGQRDGGVGQVPHVRVQQP